MGEKFVPIERLRKLVGAIEPCEHFKNTFLIHRSGNKDEGGILGFSAICMHIDQYYCYQKLFEWHFDVFNLIPQELAIDINTLKIN